MFKLIRLIIFSGVTFGSLVYFDYIKITDKGRQGIDQLKNEVLENRLIDLKSDIRR